MTMEAVVVIDTKDVGGIMFPWAPGQTTLAVPPAGGVCSQYSFEDENALAHIRFATLYFRGVVAGANTSWVFAKTAEDSPLVAFSDGPGQAANSNTGKVTKGNVELKLTDADTNALKDGALVPFSTAWFLSRGLGISFGQCGVFETDGSFTTSAHTDFYQEAFVKKLADLVTLEMRYEETKILNDIGTARQFPAQSQLACAADTVTLGTPMVGAMMPFTFPWFSGSRCSCNLMNILAFLNDGFNVANDSNSPTVAEETVLVPMVIELYGVTFCIEQLRAALPPGLKLPEKFFGSA
jgi:hypothetical protein